MVEYDETKWRATTLVWRGTVLSRLRGRIGAYAAWAAVLAAFESVLPVGMPEFGALAHSLVGVAMGMLLVFRTNTSYDRYWEGRKRWEGVLSAGRNLVRAAVGNLGTAGPLPQLTHAFGLALMHRLRETDPSTDLRAILGDAPTKAVVASGNPPLYVATVMTRWVVAEVDAGRLRMPQARDLDIAIAHLIDHQSACERILHTPVPFAYVVQIRQLLAFYLATLPVVLVPVMGWMVVPVTAMVAFAMLGIEEAGIEIEDPFGTDPNDLPIEAFVDELRADTAALAAMDVAQLDATAALQDVEASA